MQRTRGHALIGGIARTPVAPPPPCFPIPLSLSLTLTRAPSRRSRRRACCLDSSGSRCCAARPRVVDPYTAAPPSRRSPLVPSAGARPLARSSPHPPKKHSTHRLPLASLIFTSCVPGSQFTFSSWGHPNHPVRSNAYSCPGEKQPHAGAGRVARTNFLSSAETPKNKKKPPRRAASAGPPFSPYTTNRGSSIPSCLQNIHGLSSPTIEGP